MKTIKRRHFLKSTTALSSGVMILPNLITSPANDKLNLAFIGVGGRAGRNIKSCDIKKMGIATNNIVALCDVSDERAADGYNLYPKAKRFTDFRKMFDSMADEIDAVVISTPDHTHFPATIAAMELGKHVFVEKPLAHNIWELRTMKKAAAYYSGVITQMGNQGHTTNGIRQIKEWYEAGVLGEVKEVIAWLNGPHFSETGYFNKPEEYPPASGAIPQGLDWDSWLGPRLDREYSRYYLPKWWRGWFDFGNASLGDWACHTLDAPFWTLDLGMPTSVDSIAARGGNDLFCPDSSHIQFNFPARGSKPPVTMHWYGGGLLPQNRPEWGIEKLERSGMIMVGSKRSLITGGRPNEPRLLVSEEEWTEFQKNPPAETIARVEEEDPQGEWIRAIKGTGPMCLSTFDYAADLTEMALVGVMAQRFHTTVEYNAANMKVTNHDFDQYIKEPVREGWRYGQDLWKG